MMTTLILAAAMAGQAPRPSQAELDARTAALRAQINARAAARIKADAILRRSGRPTPPPSSLDRATTLDKRQAKRQARAMVEARDEAQARRDQAEAVQQAERLLPLQLEAQRQALENQRQWLQRQTDIERNQTMNRLIDRLDNRQSGIVQMPDGTLRRIP